VNRLQDFITEFYAHSGAPQTVDAAYCAFVWSIVVQHPEVRVGIAPEGAPEVYIAPQYSKTASTSKNKKKKKKKKKEGQEEEEESSTAEKLVVIEDAAVRPLDDLKQEYGDKLRIAVDPQRSLVAITGSHIRVSRTRTAY
jgi:oxalate---CoA ligase